jgi:putative ABC transport system permease protein
VSGRRLAPHPPAASPRVPPSPRKRGEGRGEGLASASESAPPLPLALRLARRELRGGLKGLRVFLACLVLGVAMIAGIGSLAAAIDAGIDGAARALLGGDVEARLIYRPADAAERAFLAQSGQLSEVATLRAMARSPDGGRQSLVALEAVDHAYPLYGRTVLQPQQSLAAALARRDGSFGAAIDPVLLGRLGIRVGERIAIGTALFTVRAALRQQPDAALGSSLGGLVFGPTVLISERGLAIAGMLQPGALVTYHYRVKLPTGTDPAQWAKTANARFPAAGWQIRTAAEAAPGLKRLIDRVALFLSFIGLSALLVGGVGIGNAVGFYIGGKTATIATLKCLGAPNRLVLAAYALQILVLAFAAIAGALALGALLPLVAAPLLGGLLPAALRFGLYPLPLALAALYGLLTVLVFALWPLAGIGEAPAGALFRDSVARARRRRPLWVFAVIALAAASLAALAVSGAGNREIALWFVGGAAAAFALFRLIGEGLVQVVRRLPRPRRPLLRLALANLGRPDAPTAEIVLSLGLGLTLFVAAALVEGNLAREIAARLPAAAPSFFFIDIAPDQLAPFERIVRAMPGARFEQVPMLRGRITRLDGVSVRKAKVLPGARWALDSDRGITYSATLPQGSQLVAGSWWPPDYRGPPLVSFDADLARDMGLKVGDSLTVTVLGRDITARIANLRRIDWRRLGINFVLVFAPGTFEGAPQTHLATVYLPQAEEEPLLRRVTRALPNVAAIPVHKALDAVGHVVATLGTAVETTTLLTLLAGVLVLGGALAAGRHRRVADSVVLKVLGATRGAVAGAFLIEHAALGLLAALVAGALGTLAAYLLVARLMGIAWVFLWGPPVAILILATAITVALGFVGTWRALSAEAAVYLRNE